MKSCFKDIEILRLKNDPNGWKYSWTRKGITQYFLTLKRAKEVLFQHKLNSFPVFLGREGNSFGDLITNWFDPEKSKTFSITYQEGDHPQNFKKQLHDAIEVMKNEK